MQTKPEAEVSSLNGARHVPLLRQAQLVAGVIFCGIASDHVHEVVSVTDDTIQIQRLPREILSPHHVHAFTQFGNTTCMCGLSNRPIAPLMPEDGTTPRAHVLEPFSLAQGLEPYSVYMAEKPDGTLMTFSTYAAGAPSVDELPVVTRATRIWGLPPAAIALIRESAPSVASAEQE